MHFDHLFDYHVFALTDIHFYLGQKVLSSPHMYKFPKFSTFDSQEVTGRCLVRMTENSLMRLGIIHPEHRYTSFRAEKVNTYDCTIF